MIRKKKMYSARDGDNWYGYAGQNPVNYTDPDGRRMDIYISKSNGTMECTFTCHDSDTLRAVAKTM